MDEPFRYEYAMPPLFSPEELRPTAAEWAKHAGLFLLTFFTATVAGLLMPLGVGIPVEIPNPQNAFEWIFVVPFFYAHVFASVFRALAMNPQLIWSGLAFSGSLLAILTAHEFGHYIACRLYGVKASLPYFIPTPPFVGPAGTLGAVIKMQSPMPSRRAIFDIGVAGPIAGFVVIIPIAILGLAMMENAPPGATAEYVFADPLLTRLLGALMGVDPTQGTINPFYSAAWVGLLVTAMNLLPASQLDGGHAVFSVFGKRAHFLIGRVAFVAMVVLTVLGWELYGSPATLVFTILLLFLLRLPHPEPLIDDPLDRKRLMIAFLTLVIFVLSFMPFPIQIH